MLKVILKEPVGGFIAQGGVAARSVQYMWSPGFVTKRFMTTYREAKKNREAIFFVDAIAAMSGTLIDVDNSRRQIGFLIDPDNIAWIQEYPDSVKDTEPDFKRV